jgi:hypothetical protein
MQHSIEQKSGSFAINGANGETEPSISANTVADAINRVKILFLPSCFIDAVMFVSNDGCSIHICG